MKRYFSAIADAFASGHVAHARICIKVVIMALMALCMLAYIVRDRFIVYRDMIQRQDVLLIKIDLLSRYAVFVHELQIERGLSFGMSGAKSEDLKKQIVHQYDAVDSSFYGLPDHVGALSSVRQKIDAARNDLKSGSPEVHDIFNQYTVVIQVFLDKISNMALAAETGALHKKEVDYVHLLLAQEYLGRLRAFIYRATVLGKADALTREVASGYFSFFSFYIDSVSVSPQSYPRYSLRELREKPDFVSVMTLVKTWIAGGQIRETPASWFAQSTKVIDSLQAISQACLDAIQTEVQGTLRDSRRDGYVASLLLLLIGGLVLVVTVFIVIRIVTPLNKIVNFIEKRVETGDFNERLEVRSGNEFGVIAASLNGMLDYIGYIINEKDRIAYHDALTSVYNRYKFKLLIANELHRVDRYKDVFSFLIFDIDHFKSVNDTFGHNVGDAVLCELAQLVAKDMRHNDVLARWGGEEFVVLLPETPVENASRFAEKIRGIVDSHSFATVGHVTISVGVTSYVEGDTLDSLCGRADTALYNSKEQGRNRVTVRTKDVPQAS